MKRLLLLGLSLSAIAAGAWADAEQTTTVCSAKSLKVTKIKSSTAVNVKKLDKTTSVVVKDLPGGLKIKRLNSVRPTQTINPVAKAKAMAKAPGGTSFFESFEEGTFAATGWSTESKGEFTEGTAWAIAASSSFIEAPDGSQMASITYSDKAIEEWLISPVVSVDEFESLNFWAYFAPAFFYSMDNVDWNTYEYIGDRIKIGDLEVCIREEGGEWKQIWSGLDVYKDKSFMDMLTIDAANYSISLEEFAGKKIQFAFKYWGTDCNTVAIDAVSIAKPSLEGVLILEPFETLYWGTDRSADWSSLNLVLAQEPVLVPLTWDNYSDYVEGATYSWKYHDPVTNDYAFTTEETLTATYKPDFTSAFTSRNNLYYAPELTGSAPGASDATYTRGYTYFQAGGKPEFEVTTSSGSKELMTFGLLPYPLGVDGHTVTVIDDSTIGDASLPIFGHNANVDKYWLNYSLNGEQPEEGDNVKLNGYCNFVFAPGQPLVVTGTHALAIGQITDAAQFRCDIYACPITDAGYVIDDANIIATAYCPASKVLTSDGGTNQYLNIVFDFDTPVILDNVKAGGYLVKISGFNSDAVTYFAPVQSELPNPAPVCHGYIEKFLTFGSYTGGTRQSFTPIAYVEGEHGAMFNGFAINLDGYYPFIHCETTELEVPVGGNAEVVLGSYYDGADLTVTAPEGITAQAAGRYDSCILTVSATDENAQGDIVLTSHGVEHKIAVKATNGIQSITADDATIAEVFTLDGRRIAPEKATKGLYIVRRSDGSTSKAIIR